MKEILLFELRYQASQKVFPLALLAFAFFGFALTATGFGPESVALLSPWLLAEMLGILSLLAVFPAAIFASQAVLRDEEHGMTDLLLSTPISKSRYLGSRFAGALAATLLVLLAAALGLVAGTLRPSHDAERLAAGLGDPLGWLLAFLLIVLPALAFSTALLFALAVKTRSSLFTAVGSLLLYFLYFAAAAATDSPLMASAKAGAGESLSIAAWLDPFGLSSFFSHTLFWTAAEKNTLLPYGGILLANRLGTIALAAALLAFTWRTFRVESRTRASGLKRGLEGGTPSILKPSPRGVQGGTPCFLPSLSFLPSPSKVWSSKAALELRHLFASWPLWLALTMWLLLAASELASLFGGGEYGSSLLPTTGAILAKLEQPFRLFGLILLVHFGTELMWLESAAKIEPVFDATPARSGSWVWAKWLTLSSLVLLLGLTSVALGIAVQLLHGFTDLAPEAYLAFLLFSGLPLAIFAAVSILLHRLSPNRYLGLFACLLLALLVEMGGGLGLESSLLRFGRLPALTHSGLAGFGGAVPAAAIFLLLWSLVALLAALLAAAIWRRGEKRSWRERRVPIAIAGLLLIALAGAIHWQTHIVNRFESTGQRLAWRERYERQYGELAGAAQPQPAALEAKIDLFPREARARFTGSYLLENRGTQPIPTLWVTVPRQTEVRALGSAAAATSALDAEFGVYRMELRQPLEPGGSLALDFDLEIAEKGLANEGKGIELIENGSYLPLFGELPTFGFRPGYRIRDPRERRRRGLPELAADPETGHGDGGGATAWVKLQLEITTDADQIAIGPGRLAARRQEGGRAVFAYDSAGASLPHAFAVASARYRTLRRETQAGAAVEVYHDGRQPAAAEEIAAIAAASLEHFAAAYGRAYPFPSLRLAELPRTWRFGGFAIPGAIFLPENRSFELDQSSEASGDLLARRVAHEVAHQWWGHQLSPAPGPGASVLVESLAKYSELEMVERLRGKKAAQRLMEFELEQYLKGRADASGDEKTLAEVESEDYLFYRKGALATRAIAAALGPRAFGEALAALLAKQAGPGRSPRIGDLIAELETRASSPAATGKIEELMRGIVLWDFSIAEARFEGGMLHLEIDAGKWRADGGGRETELSFAGEEVELALEFEGGEQIRRLKLDAGRNRLDLEVEGKPLAVALDPDVLFIDKSRWNNRRHLP